MDLLTKVVIGCGPSIYNADMFRRRVGQDRNRPGQDQLPDQEAKLVDGLALDAAIQDVMTKYGSGNRNKYRAVVYYMLCVHFGKQAVYA